jgi:hypothetical protein
MVGDAEQYGDSSKEQINYLKEAIRSAELLNRAKFNENVSTARQVRDSETANLDRFGVAPDDPQRQAVKEDYEKTLQAARDEADQDKEQTDLLRQVILSIRETANRQILADKRGDESLESSISRLEESDDPRHHITAQILREQQQKQEEAQNGEQKSGDSRYEQHNSREESFFSQANQLKLMERAFAFTRQMGQSQNGYDLFGSLAASASAAVGGIFSSVPVLGSLISSFGELGGQLMQRKMETQQSVMTRGLSLRALTGKTPGVNDLSAMGIDYETDLLEQNEMARRSGSAKNLTQKTEEMLYMNKGLSLNKESLYDLVEMNRNTGKELGETIGGILYEGQTQYFQQDRAFLNEFVQKYIGLQRELLKGSTKVGDLGVMDIMRTFDHIGGQWKTNDFRSEGNMMAVQDSLANPGSEALDAMQLSILRQINPQMGMADLLMEREKGLNSPEYFQSMLKGVMSLGGGEDYQRETLYGMMGGKISRAGIKEMWDSRYMLANSEFRSQEEFANAVPGGYFKQEAVAATSTIDANIAEIRNAFVTGAVEGLQTIGSNLVDVIREVFRNSSIQLSNGVINLPASVPANPTRAPAR